MDWPFTGRGGELDLVTTVLGAEAGYRGMVLVGGAGVGKSRLAREAAGVAAERGWAVRQVEGTAAGQGIPLGAFSNWINRLDGPPLDLASEVVTAISAGHAGRIVVTVDDAHLLDDLSAFVLHKLIADGLARVIITLRSGEEPPRTVTELWKNGRLQRLDLQPLSREECDRLLTVAVGGPLAAPAAQRLWELTDGNVLFLHHLVRQEVDAGRLSPDDSGCWQWTGPVTVSATLADLVQADIGSAPQAVIDVVDLVALAEPLDFSHLTALADPAAVEEAERRGLIRMCHCLPADRVRIGHPLYAETRRCRMGSVRAKRLRGRAVNAITTAAPGANPVDPVRLGLLWLESDLPPDSEVMYEAAEEAFRRLDTPLSQRLTEASIRAGGGMKPRFLHARTLALLGRADEAEELLNSLAAGDVHDPMWPAATNMRALSAMLAHGDPDRSWAMIDDALARAPEPAVAELTAFRVVQLAMAARPAEAVEIAESIDRERLTDLARINLNYGLTIALGDVGRPHAATRSPVGAMVNAARPPATAYQAVALALIHADTLVTNGCIAEARTLAEDVVRQWAELPEVPLLIAAAVEGMAALGYGDLPTALRLLQAVLDRQELRDDRRGLPYLGVACLLSVSYTEAMARAGRVEDAVEAMGLMERSRHPAYSFIESNRLLAQAWVAAVRGLRTEAVALAGDAADFARAHGQLAREVSCLQAAIQFGDTRSGDRLTELAGLVEGPRAGIAARWAAALTGRDGPALMQVSDDLETMGDRIAAADAAAQAGRIFERANLRGARLTAVTRAERIAAECGARTPAIGQAVVPLALTRREWEIAALVREGLSNKQIAETLSMSVRTVEGHIYRACTKLGVAGRTELAALVG
ncbi:LuxR C-terminal-related transcriptional regulator [Mycolicibacterium sp.]|uniref:helix-turn-helix transcriptional regulator n=1 Tax=Mycolicibacterium sp. TaxID=2320850 RepID=UPI0028ACF418|nr:LuxR C-terminal-related transcriptional regulator [Mycolicibacterium sp.]